MSNMPKIIGEQGPLAKLASILQEYNQVTVLLSGGMDSAFLLWACTQFLPKDRIKAVTCNSPTTPRQELARAIKTAEILGVEHIILFSPEMEDEDFCRNDDLRCYYCKRSRLTHIKKTPGQNWGTLLDGTHLDDLKEYRPGMKAAREFGISSPLLEAGLDRAAIKSLAVEYQLPLPDRPVESCLATRIKTGQRLDIDLMAKLDELEEAIRGLGIALVRARWNSGEIRLEVRSEDLPVIMDNREKIINLAKKRGFSTVSLDLRGYGPRDVSNKESEV